MDDKNYKSIITKAPFGFAYHKIIVDDKGKPTDYEFLEVNPAFELITGLKAKDIIGKTVCEVLPGIREGNFDWVKYYGDIALNGGDGEVEHYSKPLGSWYKVQAYSEQKHYFSTVFTDITAQKTLSDIAATFNNFSAQTINLQYLADKAREISGAAYAVLNKFDEDGRGSSTLAFSGLNKHLEKAISMLGFDPRGKRWDYDPVRQKKIDNQKTTVFQQLSDLTGTAIPPQIITLISKTLNIGQVAVVKSTRENIMLGDFTLIFKRGTQLKNSETIETYADLTGMLLSRIDEERKAINEQARLKTITDNMTDLVWESDLKFINTYTSPSVNRIFGFSVEDDMPLTFEERLTPESLQTSLSLLQEELEKENDPLVSKSRSRLVELEYYKKDGSIISMESNISFVRDKNGKPVGLRGVSRDITGRKKTELALKQRNDIVENIQLGLYIYHLEDVDDDSTLRMTYANPATEIATGIKVEDILGKTLDENFPHLRALNVPQRYAEVVIKQEQKTFEDIFYGDDRVMQAVFSVKAFPLPNNFVGIAFENITERVQAQIQVAESNNRLKLAQEIGNVGSWELDFISNIVTWSAQTYLIYEEDPDTFEVNFDTISAHYPPADKAAVIAAMNKTIAEQIDLNIEHEIITGKGNTRFVFESGRLIFSDENKPVKLVGSVADITERKNAEKALKLQNVLLKTQQEVSLDGILIVDENDKIISFNQRFADIWEIPDEIMALQSGEKALQYVLPKLTNPDEFVQGIRDLHNNKQEKSYQEVFLTDGKILERYSSPLIGSADEYYGRIWYYRDITERKQAERLGQEKSEKIAAQNEEYLQINEELYQTNSELIEVKERIEETKIRLEMAIDAGEHGFWDWNLITNHTFFSPTYYTMLGYEDKELPMTLDTFMQLIHTDDSKVVMPIVQQSIEMGKSYEVEFQLKCKDGSFKWILGKGKSYYNDESGKPYRAVGVHIDINDRKIAEQELIKAKEKAEEANQLKTAFINNISHEIRTPLNGILGFGQFLVESQLSEKERRELFKHVEKSSDRLMNTVSDYMDMAMIFSGTMKVNKNEFLLRQLFEEISGKAKLLIAEKNIGFDTVIPSESADMTVTSDFELLGKTLYKLLDNAIKFTNEGSVKCGYSIKPGYVELFVQDTGKGIAADKLKMIFDMFSQEDSSLTRGYEGSGLGLAIARGLVTLLGGEITVVSEKGKGSVFTFTIPSKIPDQHGSACETNTIKTKPKSNAKPLILIAEDDDLNFIYLETVLNLEGYSFLHAVNGKEAVDFCRQRPEISIVLMDIKMPVMNGIEATKLIRAFKPELPIVATTAYAQTGDQHELLAAGCNEYIAKPLKKGALLEIIQKYLNK